MFIGKKLKKVREARKISQRTVGAYLGVPQPRISEWETCRVNPPLSLAVALADYYGVTIGHLIRP